MILSWVANEAEYKNQLVPVTRYDHILRMISSIGSLPTPVNDIPSLDRCNRQQRGHINIISTLNYM